jgi:hypothetical protein
MIVTEQAAVTTSAKIVFTGTRSGASLGAVTFTNTTASQTIYVGGANVATTNGYPLANGTLPAAGSQLGASVVFAPCVGDVWAVASAASTLAIAYSFED